MGIGLPIHYFMEIRGTTVTKVMPSESNPRTWRMAQAAGNCWSKQALIPMHVRAGDGSGVWAELPIEEFIKGDCRPGITIACCRGLQERECAWRLSYGKNGPSRGISFFDLVPGSLPLLLRRDGVGLATMSVVPDSVAGLPSEATFPTEIAALRNAGRRMFEFCGLAAANEWVTPRWALWSLFKAGFLYARYNLAATDVVISVTPRHAGYFEQALLFEKIPSASESPLLMRLDLENCVANAEKRFGPESEYYQTFWKPTKGQNDIIAWLKYSCSPMSSNEIVTLLSAEPKLATLRPEERALLHFFYRPF